MRAQRGTVAQSASFPAPVGGWNARDPIADMPPTDAVRLDNWFPRAGGVDVRKGYAAHCTIPVTGDVETLGVWNGTSSSKLWAFATDTAPRAFDCSVAGSPTANAAFDALAHTGTVAQYAQTMVTNSAGTFLWMCDQNGVNAPFYYNGTTFTAPALTGITATDVVHVSLFKYRLFFALKNSLSLGYLGLDAIAGAVSRYPLGGFLKEGGYIVATATWTMDGGDGVDDKFVVITSKGQVAVFSGTDPTTAAAWQIEGVYQIAAPIGRRCFQRVGGDLLVLTLDGLVPMSAVTQGIAKPPTVSDKVRKAFRDSAKQWGTTFGWQTVFYPRGPMLLTNIPQYAAGNTTRKSHQYVLNTDLIPTGGGWCRFTDQDAQCWALFNDDVYFGTPGFVRKADAATDDAGNGILAQCRQAFTYLNLPDRKKLVTMVRPTLDTDADTPIYGMGVDVDFEAIYVPAPSASIGSSSSVWDVAAWDIATWDGDLTTSSLWTGAGGLGYCFALVFNVMLKSASLSWYATTWLYQPATRPGP